MKAWLKQWLASAVIGVTFAGAWPASVPAAAPPPPGAAAWRAAGGLPDPVGATPADIAAFFARLPAPAAADLTGRYPGVVGNLDGAPIPLRYRANATFGAQTLVYDPAGDGKVAVVVGDLASAARIAVLVPGVDTTLANVTKQVSWARQLHDASEGRVAVIAWLGYDAPKGAGRAAIRSERAVAGAAALERFVAGLVAQCPQATIAVIGHSYGSLVMARAAARLPGAVTDLVAIGSPGLDVDRAAELRTSARLWAGSTDGDWTLWIPDVRVLGIGHGVNPSRRWFGALPLDVSDADGHDGYFAPGTASLRSLATVASLGAGRIVTGRALW